MRRSYFRTLLTAGMFSANSNKEIIQLFIIYQMRHNKYMKKIEKFSDFIAQGLFATIYGGWGYSLFRTPSLINVFTHNLWIFCLAFVTGAAILWFIRHLMPELVKRMVNKNMDGESPEKEEDNNEE